MAAQYRSVIYEHRFDADRARLRRGARRIDDFIDAAEWVLCRDPYQGIQIPGTQVWALTSRNYAYRLRPIIIYYAFNADEVYFLSVERT